MSDYLPLYIDFKGRRIVIFGGGGVGERKARYFSGVADVTVVSPAFTPALEAMGGITRIQKAAAREEIGELISGAFLVIAATGDEEFNSAVVREAQSAGILVNSAHGESGVILPSRITKGDISVAIATGGKSPAMSKYLRQRLEAALGEEMADMVRLQADVREVLKKVVPEQKDRERLLWDILKTPAVWEAMKTSYDDALTLALMMIEERRP
ncbi:precorrin-2 dehydrogenase/sirohydrochlorin ferrochelatase family protein [Methanocella arvoryzae]|uniref:precorrin-2 dehydrogenase n=1 Tax=Methanocella arvoryzae (strain DSM 22066 / NBRC 105507 / MRE50) TaxID=351160 RepID=Q0W5T7_METAR|nr:bifunctional precorrin-2 dehydrogenase/sirohydrochlorin ferrochelatase [Methanocella arvoryzae]CAJ36256.1 putative bifunctional precorrin-2 oxidase/ferrochelatase [Methanocella arvoryzae MRE50]